MTGADGRYDYSARNGNQPPWAYLQPFASNEERLTQQALQAAFIPGADLQKYVRPPLPQVQLFPPRFGYGVEQPGIRDVIDVDRVFPSRITDYSGGPGSYSGSSVNTNSMGQV